MSSQNIPLKARSDSRDPAEFWPQRLFAFEVRRWGDAVLVPGSQRAFLRERWSQPCIQGIPDRAIAVDTAKRMNDDLAEQVLAAHPNRFAGFAAVALQDVRAAGDE